MMKRTILLAGAVFLTALLGFASSAMGQSQGGDGGGGGGGEAHSECICGVPAANAVPDGECFDPRQCDDAEACNVDAD